MPRTGPGIKQKEQRMTGLIVNKLSPRDQAKRVSMTGLIGTLQSASQGEEQMHVSHK
jgi:hypothetical protein